MQDYQNQVDQLAALSLHPTHPTPPPFTPEHQLVPYTPSTYTLTAPDNYHKRRLNAARQLICPRSPIYTADFDYTTHAHEWSLGETRRLQTLATYASSIHHLRLSRDLPAPPPLRQAFDGQLPAFPIGPVLGLPTIFTHTWRLGKEAIAPWPSKHEMTYEGDGRIATDRIHRRFLPLPRVLGNETVNWQQRRLVEAEALDYRYEHPGHEGVFFWQFEVAELEFSEEEAREVLGGELMALLDPLDQW
ncbi:hypothetical protein MBLNU230_g8395t1 [Neophaeotheca triangularis]